MSELENYITIVFISYRSKKKILTYVKNIFKNSSSNYPFDTLDF